MFTYHYAYIVLSHVSPSSRGVTYDLISTLLLDADTMIDESKHKVVDVKYWDK